MLSPRATISKLRVRAAGEGPESEVAKAALRDLEAKYPTEAALAASDSAPKEMREFPVKGRHERAAFTRLCSYFELEAYSYKRGKGLQGKSVLLAEGPAGVLDALPTIWNSIKKQIDDLHWGATVGFMLGALPIADKDDDDGPDAEPLSEDALAAARAAYCESKKHQPRTQIAGCVSP